MPEHSPEPWEVYPGYSVDLPGIKDDRSAHVVYPDGVVTPPDAARIVACVNACKGISTEWLELVGTGGVRTELDAFIDDVVERPADGHEWEEKTR